jgi:ribosomal protein S11
VHFPVEQKEDLMKIQFRLIFGLMLILIFTPAFAERGVTDKIQHDRGMGGAIQGNELALADVVTTVAGLSLIGTTDGMGAAAKFNFPQGITTDGRNLYVADTGNNTIRKIVISTGAVTTLAGSAGQKGSADGTGAAARFDVPAGITTDGTNLYVADSSNNTIRKIVISTGAVTTLAGSAGLGQAGSADGRGAAARFCRPQGITTDGNSLYVSDTCNNAIRKIQ